jgi:hypothetical protein
MTFESLTQAEINAVLERVPVAVQRILQREDVVLAGGVIRDTLAGLPVKDVDIFCHSAEQAERLALQLSPFVRHTTFAYTVDVLGTEVQFVFYKDFADAKDLIRQFDFRACCASVYWQGQTRATDEGGFAERGGYWQGVAVEGFRADCREHVLRFMSQEKDAGKLTALGRALHLAKRGWTLSVDEAASIITHWQPKADHAEVRRSFRPAYGRV